MTRSTTWQQFTAWPAAQLNSSLLHDEKHNLTVVFYSYIKRGHRFFIFTRNSLLPLIKIYLILLPNFALRLIVLNKFYHYEVNGKAIPLRPWTDPECSRQSAIEWRIAWSGVFLEKLSGSQLGANFPVSLVPHYSYPHSQTPAICVLTSNHRNNLHVNVALVTLVTAEHGIFLYYIDFQHHHKATHLQPFALWFQVSSQHVRFQNNARYSRINGVI